MSHHSQDGTLGGRLREILSDALGNRINESLEQKLGATGRYPDGKVSEQDEGEIVFAVAGHNGKVFIDFGKPVHSLGMNPDQALQLAALLVEKAANCRMIGASKEPGKVKV